MRWFWLGLLGFAGFVLIVYGISEMMKPKPDLIWMQELQWHELDSFSCAFYDGEAVCWMDNGVRKDIEI